VCRRLMQSELSYRHRLCVNGSRDVAILEIARMSLVSVAVEPSSLNSEELQACFWQEEHCLDHNYKQTQPTTYNNALLLGVLAMLHGGHGGYNLILLVQVPVAMPIVAET
nr:endoglucanase 6-like [Tanacetum cinerariifolium]